MTSNDPAREEEIGATLDRVSETMAIEGMPLTKEDRALIAHQLRGDFSDEQFVQLVRVLAQALPVLSRARAILGSVPVALDWLRTSNLALEGRVPLGLLGTDDGAAQVLGLIGGDLSTAGAAPGPTKRDEPDDLPDAHEYSTADALREALLGALPENPPTAHHGSVQRARILIVALADAAWTVIREGGKGGEAREAGQFIDKAMSSLGGRRAETQATTALIDAIAKGALAMEHPHAAGIECTDRHLTGFWWDWPEYANRLDLEIYRNAVRAWVAADRAGPNARWNFVVQAVADAGLPPQEPATLKRLWQRLGPGPRRPGGM
jgi:hypothetical protein